MDWLIFGGIMITIMVLMFVFLSRRIHRQYNSKEFLDEVQREVNVMVTELNQTTERNIQLIEDRMQKLNVLMKEADRRILLANQELTKRQASTETYEHLAAAKRTTRRGEPAMRHEQAVRQEPSQRHSAAREIGGLFDEDALPERALLSKPDQSRVEEARFEPFVESENNSDIRLSGQGSPAQGAKEGAVLENGARERALRDQIVSPRIKTPSIADLIAKNTDPDSEDADAARPSWRPDEAIAPGSRATPKPLTRDAMKAQIIEMAAAGIAPSIISQRFNITAGEVELILSLSRGVRT